jgi:hypothetical protein
MEKTIIRLRCLRNDGRRESMKLEHLILDEARQVAEQVLRLGNGLYTEVEICTESGYTETIQKDDAVGATSSKVWSLRLQ